MKVAEELNRLFQKLQGEVHEQVATLYLETLEQAVKGMMSHPAFSDFLGQLSAQAAFMGQQFQKGVDWGAFAQQFGAQSDQNYAELGLRPDCEDEVLEAAYRVLARKHHPDHGGDPERMARINRAYQEIKMKRGG